MSIDTLTPTARYSPPNASTAPAVSSSVRPSISRLPTQARLAEVLRYDPETGGFWWLVSPSSNVAVGDLAGSIDKGLRYRRIGVDGFQHYAHRLAFIAMTGDCPSMIDHINRDRSDNRWRNLRAAEKWQNLGNSGPSARNTSGVKGVCWHKAAGKWHAQIRANGRHFSIGLFDCIEDAANAYKSASDLLRGEFSCNHVDGDVANLKNRPPIMEIIRKTSNTLQISINDILGKCRKSVLVEARRDIAKTCSRLGYSHAQIANRLKRDRSTISALLR